MAIKTSEALASIVHSINGANVTVDPDSGSSSGGWTISTASEISLESSALSPFLPLAGVTLPSNVGESTSAIILGHTTTTQLGQVVKDRDVTMPFMALKVNCKSFSVDGNTIYGIRSNTTDNIVQAASSMGIASTSQALHVGDQGYLLIYDEDSGLVETVGCPAFDESEVPTGTYWLSRSVIPSSNSGKWLIIKVN